MKRAVADTIMIVLMFATIGVMMSVFTWLIHREGGPRFIDVDGQRCRLYEAQVGITSHGSPRYETRATCRIDTATTTCLTATPCG